MEHSREAEHKARRAIALGRRPEGCAMVSGEGIGGAHEMAPSLITHTGGRMVRRVYAQRSLIEVLVPDADKR